VQRLGAREGLREVGATIRDITRYRTVFLFILAYMLYIDGVNTVIRMATKFGSDLNFEPSVLMTALLMTQFIAFPAALVFGRLGGWISVDQLCVFDRWRFGWRLHRLGDDQRSGGQFRALSLHD
jgi:MFS-type transporter involved in bile tolerance (Atg22 family)